VRGRVIGAEVRLSLDDPAGERLAAVPPDDEFAQQLARNLIRRPDKKSPRQG
jgi:hypothetical protein